MNLLLQDALDPGEVIRPRCWNRPAVPASTTRHGIDSATGAAISVTLRNDWFVDRCTQFDGAGIGPNGESYAVANKHDCTGCRWLPEAHR